MQCPNGSTVSDADVFTSLRTYLIVVARSRLSRALARKVGPSDIVQETLLVAQRHVELFRDKPDIERKRWLRRILEYRIAAAYRKNRIAIAREAQHDVEADWNGAIDSGSSPSTRPQREDRVDAVRRAFGQLTPREQQVVIWRQEDGLGFAEIGDRLGLTQSAAGKIWARALIKLKDALGPEYAP